MKKRTLWIGGLVAGAAALVAGTYFLTKKSTQPGSGTATVNVQLPQGGTSTSATTPTTTTQTGP